MPILICMGFVEIKKSALAVGEISAQSFISNLTPCSFIDILCREPHNIVNSSLACLQDLSKIFCNFSEF